MISVCIRQKQRRRRQFCGQKEESCSCESHDSKSESFFSSVWWNLDLSTLHEVLVYLVATCVSIIVNTAWIRNLAYVSLDWYSGNLNEFSVVCILHFSPYRQRKSRGKQLHQVKVKKKKRKRVWLWLTSLLGQRWVVLFHMTVDMNENI